MNHFIFKKTTLEQLVHELTCLEKTEQVARRTIAWVEYPGLLWRMVETTARQDIWGRKAGETRREIVCDEIRRNEDTGELGVRSIPESAHPRRYCCPLHFLEMTPVASAEWRARVRAYHQENETLYRELKGVTNQAAVAV